MFKINDWVKIIEPEYEEELQEKYGEDYEINPEFFELKGCIVKLRTNEYKVKFYYQGEYKEYWFVVEELVKIKRTKNWPNWL